MRKDDPDYETIQPRPVEMDVWGGQGKEEPIVDLWVTVLLGIGLGMLGWAVVGAVIYAAVALAV